MRRLGLTATTFVLIVAAFAHATLRAQQTAVTCPSIPSSRTSAADTLEISLPSPLDPFTHPRENPATAAKISLGRELFFDSRLSRNDRIACATCHDPIKGFSNGQQFAMGIDGRPGQRHVPSLINVGYSMSLFWDGRAATIEEQALLPIQNPAEMNLPLNELEQKLSGIAEYREQFERVFGGPPSARRVGQALAAYERTIISSDTPFDVYLRGDRDALSARATRGMQLFFGRARCSVCHTGSQLTDNQFHNVGTADLNLPDDSGRRAITGLSKDHAAFRTPQLREVAKTAPYMHNGSFPTLKKVVEHYNFGAVADQANVYRDEALEVLYLSEDEVDDLVAFLTEGLSTKSRRTDCQSVRP